LNFRYRAREYIKDYIKRAEQERDDEPQTTPTVDLERYKAAPDAFIIDQHFIDQLVIGDLKKRQNLPLIQYILDTIVVECIKIENIEEISFDQKEILEHLIEFREIADNVQGADNIMAMMQKRRKDEFHARIKVFLQQRFPIVFPNWEQISPLLKKILMIIDDFMEIWRSNKPINENESTSKALHLLKRRIGIVHRVIQDFKHNLEFEIASAPDMILPPVKRLRVMQSAFDTILREVFLDKSSNAVLNARDPSEISFSFRVECRPSAELVKILGEKIDKRTTKFDLLQKYVRVAIEIENRKELPIGMQEFDKESKRDVDVHSLTAMHDFIDEYNNDVKELRTLKERLEDENRSILDVFLDDPIKASDFTGYLTLREYDVVGAFNEIISLQSFFGSGFNVDLDKLKAMMKRHLEQFVYALHRQEEKRLAEHEGPENPKAYYTRK